MIVAYGNRQNAAELPRANNSDLLQELKHVMETRLYQCSEFFFQTHFHYYESETENVLYHNFNYNKYSSSQRLHFLDNHII